MVTLTNKAALQVNKIRETQETDAAKHLRIAVVSGGCAGYQYQIGLDKAEEGDSVFTQEGISIVVDPKSLSMVDGMEIDFQEGFHGSSFLFKNPNADRGCGCGKSFH